MKRQLMELGFRSGKLCIIHNDYGKNKYGQNLVLCKCDCGKQVTVIQSAFKSGHTQSCGCLQIERTATAAKNRPADKRSRKGEPWMQSAKATWRRSYKDGCSFEKFLELSQQNCFYCGSQPSNEANYIRNDCSPEWRAQGIFVYNGLDRIDSTKNHSEDNIIPCCRHCNAAKMAMTQKEFYKWIKNLYRNLIEKGIIRLESFQPPL